MALRNSAISLSYFAQTPPGGDKLPGRLRHRRRPLGLGQARRRVGGGEGAGPGGAAWFFGCSGRELVASWGRCAAVSHPLTHLVRAFLGQYQV